MSEDKKEMEKKETPKVELTKQECNIIVFSFRTLPELYEAQTMAGGKVLTNKPRQLDQLTELPKAIEIMGLLPKDLLKEKEGYCDGAVALSTDLKAFILKMIERPWHLDDGKVYLGLKEKLK